MTMTPPERVRALRDDSDERELWLCALRQLGACGNAVAWLQTVLATGTVDEAWATCPRGDWLLWLIGRLDVSPPWSDERKPLVRAACDCARLALAHTNDARVLRCIEVTEAWCRGAATIDEVRDARHGAVDAAYAARAADDYAAYADAGEVAVAAYAAADAAYAAYAAADAAYAYAARTSNHAQCADLVRRHYPRPPALL